MDTLITVIFFIIVAILSAVLKKKQHDAGKDDGWSGGDSTSSPSDRRAPRRESWEDELRRLLEGTTGQEPSRPSPPPPPPLPQAPPRQPPVIVPEPAPVPSSPARPAWLRKVEARKEEAVEQALKLREKRRAAANRFEESMKRLRRASQLDDRAASTIRQAANRIHVHVEEGKFDRTPLAVKNALGWLKTTDSLRSAMVVSVVLGPPKSMEFDTGQAG